jgi:hypothetical protein
MPGQVAAKRLRLYTVRDLIALLYQYTIKLLEGTFICNPLKPALYIACVLVAQPVCRGKYNNFLLLLITFQVS